MGSFWVTSAVVMLLIGAALNSAPLLLIAALVVVLSLTSKRWADYCLTNVEYVHWLDSNRVFVGEDVQLITQITNRKFLPLPWVQVYDELPQSVKPLNGYTAPAPDPTRISLISYLSMKWYHQIRREYTLRCLHRGHFTLGPVRIRSGDLFGMFTRETRISSDQSLTVYPTILPVVFSDIPSKDPYGNVRIRRALLDDMTRPVGSRNYYAGDDLRRIHWKATARVGQLQTKVFDYSTSMKFVIFFSVRTIEPPLQGSRPHLLELGVLTVTALANYALEKGLQVGVYVNQTSHDTARSMRVPPGRHTGQLTRILEIMAQVHAGESIALDQLVIEQSRVLPWDTTIVVVAAIPDEAIMSTLTRLRRAGRDAVLIHIGGERTASVELGGKRLTVAETMDWESLEKIIIE